MELSCIAFTDQEKESEGEEKRGEEGRDGEKKAFLHLERFEQALPRVAAGPKSTPWTVFAWSSEIITESSHTVIPHPASLPRPQREVWG